MPEVSSRPSLRLLLLAAVAPLVWSTTYIVTEKWLPDSRPMFSALMRALPMGIVLLLWRRTLPPAGWWGKAVVLGVLNIGAFFPLIYLSAYGLPGGLAGTIQALLPLAVMASAFVLVRERPTVNRLVGGVVGLVGVALMVLGTTTGITALGLFGAFASIACTSIGAVLVKRWDPPVDNLTLVSWQLVVGGVMLLPLAFAIEGAPPAIDLPAALGYLWIGVMGTGVAYWCWFTAMQQMPAGSVALISLLNPLSATVIGVVVAHEAFGLPQAVGFVLVIGGVVFGQFGNRPRPAAVTAPDSTA
ncbi:DMT family transporter [Nocardioides yefusunii]|uniref:DMT family transporter n=1 Tax=Nocardioides yefusunii TaxID=2500546 RepID=A0ABW1QVY6_9ACTN|nr:EamA family transporter [Nocardioides yefusunii]